MRKPVFAVYDSKAGYFKTPFIMQTKGEAVRSWSDVANDKSTEIGKHPEDFTLFHIAGFDEESGKYENLLTPESCGLAVEYVNKLEVKQ